jgi:photosystem II stability/assembly factor-like uncharacterized protein
MHGWIAWDDVVAARFYISKTDDGGRHWRRTDTPTGGSVRAMRLFSRDAAVVLASSTLASTRDGGATWERSSIPLLDIEFAEFASPRTGWIVGPRTVDGGPRTLSVARTEDGGSTWTVVALPGTQADMAVATARADLDRAWLAISHAGNAGSRLLETRDGGRTWGDVGVTQFRTSNTVITALGFISPKVGVVFSVDVNSNETLMYWSDDGDWRSQPIHGRVSSCQSMTGLLMCSSGMDVVRVRDVGK